MNPKAFGLSTYAVVESPELERQAPAATPDPKPVDEGSSIPSLAPVNAEASVAPRKPAAPPIDIPQTYKGNRVSTKTAQVPDPDIADLEPIPPVLEGQPPADL